MEIQPIAIKSLYMQIYKTIFLIVIIIFNFGISLRMRASQ